MFVFTSSLSLVALCLLTAPQPTTGQCSPGKGHNSQTNGFCTDCVLGSTWKAGTNANACATVTTTTCPTGKYLNPATTTSDGFCAHCGTTSTESACSEDVSASICKNPSDYLPDHRYNEGGSTCESAANHYQFTSTIQCTADPGGNDQNGQPIPGFKSKANIMAAMGCCGSAQKSACWEDVSASICKTGSDYLPTHEFQGSTCATHATYAEFTSTIKCTADPGGNGHNGQPIPGFKSKANQMAAMGCCGSAQRSACWEDISASICKTGSDYLPSHEFEGATCATRAQESGISSAVQCTADPGTTEPNTCQLDDPNGTNDACAGADADAETCAAATAANVGKGLGACYFRPGQPIPGMKSKTNKMAAMGCCGSAQRSACWEDVSASGELLLTYL